MQIVDKQNRPMFDTGSAHMKSYSQAILHELAGFINKVPNKISIAGHTDDAPYSRDDQYSNWELSADRANAARRALLGGGMASDKIARVVGLAASVPFDKSHPDAAFNRRISIVVMTKAAADAASAPELTRITNPAPAAPVNPVLPAAQKTAAAPGLKAATAAAVSVETAGATAAPRISAPS